MNNRILLSVSDGVADVRLNRPEKLNALDPDMFKAIAECGLEIRRDRGVRAVVISGEGRGFCAGLDLERLIAASKGSRLLPFTNLRKRTHGVANFAQHIIWQWRELPVPVIAAVHGIAFGGGLQLALGADIRYVAPNTRLCIVEVKWGLVPDMAGTPLMAHLVRNDVIRELTYTARIFSAQEAVGYGFATRVEADPLTAAMATAQEIAQRSPDAVRAAKRLLTTTDSSDPATSLARETEEQSKLLGTENQIEAVISNLEKRRPNFVDSRP